MKKILAIIPGVIAGVILSTGGYSQSVEPSRFEWEEFATDDTVFEKAAILIPIHLEGIDEQYYMQLDLGSDATMFYGIPFEQICELHPSWKNNITTLSIYNRKVDVLPVQGKLGNYILRSDTFYIKRDFGDSLNPPNKPEIIGTVGLDFFHNRVLMIDFVDQGFAVADSVAELDKNLLANTDTIAVNVIFNKMFVSGIKIGDRPLDNIIYDSGSSIFSLVVTKEKWQELTGRTGNEVDNTVLKIPAWGKEIEVVGAPLNEDLFLRNLKIEHPVVYYGILEGLDLSRAPFELEGLIGNVLFLDSILIIDLKNKMMMIKKALPNG